MNKKLYEELLDIDFDEFDEIIASQDVYTDGSSHSEVTAKKDDAVAEVDDLDDDLDITIDDEELDDLLSDVEDVEIDTEEFGDDGYLDIQPTEEEEEEIVDCNVQGIKESSNKNIRVNFKKSRELNESRKSHSNTSKLLKEGFYAPNVEFIWNGSQSDPQLLYKDKYFNYWDIEDAMWYDFVDEFYEGDSIKAEKDPKSDDAFRDWLNADDKVANYLDDAIFGGYDYYDKNGNVKESKKIKESKKSSKSLIQIYENKKRKTKNRIVESLLVDNVVDDIERTLKSTLDAHGISAAERVTILGLILDRMLHASDEEIEAPEYIETVITDIVEDDTIADIVKDAVESALDGETEPREETIKVATTIETPEGEITIVKEEGKEAEEEK